MDFKSDILVKTPIFASELENKVSNNSIRATGNQLEEHLGAMRFQQNYRSRGVDFRYWGADRGRPPFRPRGQMPPTRGFGVAPMTRQQPSHHHTAGSATSPVSPTAWSDPTELATWPVPNCQQQKKLTFNSRGTNHASMPLMQISPQTAWQMSTAMMTASVTNSWKTTRLVKAHFC